MGTQQRAKKAAEILVLVQRLLRAHTPEDEALIRGIGLLLNALIADLDQSILVLKRLRRTTSAGKLRMRYRFIRSFCAFGTYRIHQGRTNALEELKAAILNVHPEAERFASDLGGGEWSLDKTASL